MQSTYYKENFSWQYKNYYLSHQKKERFFFDTLPSFCRSYLTAYNRQNDTLILDIKKEILHYDSQAPQIIWLGHASFLIKCGNFTLLTDPLFGSLPFFPRLISCDHFLDNLPNIDITLVSHNHHDHMDMTSLSHIAHRFKNVIFSVPHGDKKWLKKPLFKNIYEHTWGSKLVVKKEKSEILCTFLPAYHWSRRTLFDTNNSLWGSWLIEWNDYTIYFGGDSAYFEHFQEIGNRYKINVALLPIAPVEPRKKMAKSHMNPEEAGKAFFDLNADIFVPMHWGTFNFGIDAHHEPVDLLKKWEIENKEILEKNNKKISLLHIGETLIL